MIIQDDNKRIFTLQTRNTTYQMGLVSAESGLPKVGPVGPARDTLVQFVSRERLEQLTGGKHHQGVAAQTAAWQYASVEEMLKKAEEKGEPPFLFLLDGIESGRFPPRSKLIPRTVNFTLRSSSLKITLFNPTRDCASAISSSVGSESPRLR